jgi:Tol biopolymer transport system component
VVLAVAAAGSARSAPTPAGVIAFVRAKPTWSVDINAGVDLWTVRTDGRSPRKVVGSRGWDEAPAWSPDGSQIAFQKSFYEAGERFDALTAIDVWTVGAGGRGARNLTRDGSASSPAWSPDGRALAFGRGDGVFVVRRDGTHRRQLARRDDPTAPAWSPDGHRIAFTTPDAVWTVGRDGRGLRHLARGASSDTHAVWSPDGRWIAYGAGGVFRIRAAGGRPRRVSRWDEELVWSPNGRRVALVHFGTPRHAGIFLAAPDGRGRRRLTRGLDTEPSWSPDGRAIAFRRGLLIGDIYVVNMDGSGLRNLTHTRGLDERQPAWRPD